MELYPGMDLIAYASSFDQIGVFANNVEDVASVLEVISGPDDYDSTVNQHKSKEVITSPSANPAQKNTTLPYLKMQ